MNEKYAPNNYKIFSSLKTFSLVLFLMLFFSFKGQETEKTAKDSINKSSQLHFINSTQSNQPLTYNQETVFPQIHSNLNGMVSEFVRTMYQDRIGNFWFGTNGDGLVRYDGKSLDKFTKKEGIGTAVRGIVEDKDGNVWFGTSSGLIKYDGKLFTNFSEINGLTDNEILTIEIDKDGIIWVGSVEGLRKFDGNNFESFTIPKAIVNNPEPMLSENRICDILIDRKEHIWFATDGYGISKFDGKTFEFYTEQNGLTDNNVADIFEDKQGNIWIGTFYGGVSKYDGKSFTNFTKDGIIEGVETYNFCEDHKGNIWFSAENFGVYRYDGNNFIQFTTIDGLATNGVQSIFEDKKGQLWFGTWSGISLYDARLPDGQGKTFTNVSEKEPWTK